MGRQVVDFTIEAEGRDRHKTFQLTEMSAAAAERWALRAWQALGKAGIDVGDAAALGMQGLALAGIQAFAYLPFHEAEPLLDEMWKCIKIKPDPLHPSVVRDLVDDDIEEVATRLTLRMETLRLHTAFFQTAFLSTSGSTTGGKAV